MAPILELSREFNLAVIEDACEAFGAEYRGQRAGTLGDAAAFAFYPNKQITTAEGGMIVTDDRRVATLCRSLRNQGREGECSWLCHSRLGYNYRLSELHCALGVAQMERVDEILAAREHVTALYSKFLSDVPEIALPASSANGRRSWFAYVIGVKPTSFTDSPETLRDRLMAGLRDRDIECQAYFPAIHRQPYLREVTILPHRPLPRTEWASNTCLALPFFATMSALQVVQVCSAIREILQDAQPDARPAQTVLPIDRRVASAIR